MIRPPPSSTRTAPRFPFSTLFRSFDRGVQLRRKSQPEHVARLRGIDDAIVPEARGGVIGIAFIFIFLPDWRLEGFGLLRRPFVGVAVDGRPHRRSEEHTSDLQSLMRISYAVFCLKKTHLV